MSYELTRHEYSMRKPFPELTDLHLGFARDGPFEPIPDSFDLGRNCSTSAIPLYVGSRSGISGTAETTFVLPLT
jgi:hypothetical protein